jgi:hypothetical protein
LRGNKSRNKVSVGEPAEGSLLLFSQTNKELRKNKKKVETKYLAYMVGSTNTCLMLCYILESMDSVQAILYGFSFIRKGYNIVIGVVQR